MRASVAERGLALEAKPVALRARYFYNGLADPFTDGCEPVSVRRLEELGVFFIPANRQWDRLMSLGSSTLVKTLRQCEAIPGAEIEKLKLELRDSKAGIENAPRLREVLASAETELRNLTMMGANSNLIYRATSLDSLNVLQNLLPHLKEK